jgi:hypothetical protein
MQQLQTWPQCENLSTEGLHVKSDVVRICASGIYVQIHIVMQTEGKGRGPHSGMHERLFLDTSKLFPPFSLALSTKALFAHKGAQFQKYYMHKTVAASPKLNQS